MKGHPAPAPVRLPAIALDGDVVQFQSRSRRAFLRSFLELGLELFVVFFGQVGPLNSKSSEELQVLSIRTRGREA